MPAESLARGPVTLHRWSTDDVDAMYRLVTEAQEWLRPWATWAEGPYDRDRAADFVAGCATSWASGEVYRYAITADGTLAGGCGLMRNGLPDALEIGYWLHPAHTGRGLVTIAAGLLVDEAFTVPGVTRVQIRHDVANTASAGVPRRLGFTDVGRHERPREQWAAGEVGVDIVWELTRPSR
ncbi:MAG TPA: GNAT family N-acetyltransferase [Actinophytocola sp.]|nr:GNAT family N-acetyltransferase [Actinophytocola sp.]